MKGRFANGVLRAFAPDVVSYKALRMLVNQLKKFEKSERKQVFRREV